MGRSIDSDKLESELDTDWLDESLLESADELLDDWLAESEDESLDDWLFEEELLLDWLSEDWSPFIVTPRQSGCEPRSGRSSSHFERGFTVHWVKRAVGSAEWSEDG